MTTKIPLYAMIAALILTTACGGETVVTKVEVGQRPQSSQGVLFSLPETLVVTEVPLTKVSSSPGVYFEWTPFFYPELTDNDYVREEGVAFKIGAPSFTTRGQTDPNNVYIAHIKAKAFETKTLLLEFNEDGIIARTEASSKDESIDILTSTIKTVASLAAPILPIPTANSAQTLKIAAEGKVDCQQNRATASAANARAVLAAAKSASHPFSKKLKAEAKAAQVAADETQREASGCYEQEFKKALSPREAALYESLDPAYIDFLRENFGFDFLLYVVRSGDIDDSSRSASIDLFLTLSSPQQKFIKEEAQLHGTVPCIDAPVGTKCLSGDAKIDLIRAKAIYDKIQRLRQQRETILAESTAAQVNTSTHIEFRLKELDAQIKSIEATYFLGTSSEASGTARFEFKPTRADDHLTHDLFKYSAGGSKPGICPDSVPPDLAGVFKANWPRKFLGTCHAAANYEFVAADIRDLKQLMARLKTASAGGAAAASDPVSAFLSSHLAHPGLVDLPLKTPQEKAAVVDTLKGDLNSILNGGSIYLKDRFAREKLLPGTIELINKLDAGLSASEIVQLNRLLIEDTYRKEVYRQASWTAHQVTVAVEEPAKGLASKVDEAINQDKLLEPGKRGFPYRVAPITLALVKDDNVERGRGEVRVAQLGPVRTLPANLGGRRSSYKLTYYDSSGAIKIFDMSADALIQKQNVTDLTDAATTLRDSETAKIKRETDLLNAKKDRMNAEKSLIEAEKALRAAQATPTPTPIP